MNTPTLKQALNTLCMAVRRLGDRFERRGVWSPANAMAIVLLMKMPGRSLSYRSVLGMVEEFGSSLFTWSRVPSIGSMSKARKKLSAEACRLFLGEISAFATRQLHKARHVWHKRRIIAIDGSTFVVPRSTETLRAFNRPRCGSEDQRAHHPRALMVMALDVLRRVPVDYVLGQKGQGERTLVKRLLDSICPDDVVVVDRGFPSRELVRELLSRGIDFVMRVNADEATAWKEFRPFLRGKAKSAMIELQLGDGDQRAAVSVRLVERDRQRGRPRRGAKKERMVILTNLSEADGFTREELVKVYGSRWGVETAFRELKTFMSTEPFHSKSVNGIEQELVAGLIWMALASSLESAALDDLPDGYKVVRTDCYRFAGVLLGHFMTGCYREEEFRRYVESLRRYAQKRKPNRYAERKCEVPFGRSQKRFG